MNKIPIVIDIEASGFGKDSYPIEVGFVTDAGMMWCTLIKPESNWLHWDCHAAELHQISRDILFKHGNSADAVATQLNNHLKNAIVYTDAWFHDYVWMARLYDVANQFPTFQLKDLRQILTPEQEAIWDHTKQQVLNELQLSRHRASTDARVLQLTWLRTLPT
jgi:hypothetical protein